MSTFPPEGGAGGPAERELPGTTVVICSRDRPQLLAATVESILQGELRPAEIVIVDQSGDPHPELGKADAATVRYVRSTTRGLCRARNIGLAEARHDVVAFADDDVIAADAWLSALVGGLGDEGERLVTAGQVIPTAPERPGAFASSYYVDAQPRVYQGRIDRDPLGGGNMAAYRSTLEAVGGFDERLGAGGPFPAADDNDLGLRLLEAGYRIVYVPEAVVFHRAWRPRWNYPLVRWRYGRGKGGFYGKHYGLPGAHIKRRLRRDIGHRIRRFPRAAVREPGRAVGDVAYVGGVLIGLVQWLLTQGRRA